eukprot:gb/GEZN01009702.1/.p1 GENE.gb/GEZN01009702.1/~~gb/GEZN01009702.1/.p1  ORF type:complete len:400 (-),score=51.00 gb/GEZN01009702.1/:81-1280(-)
MATSAHYTAIADDTMPASGITNPIRRAGGGLATVLLTLTAGFGAKRMTKQAPPAPTKQVAFMPKSGLDSVLIRPGTLQDSAPSLFGPSSLFVYGPLRDDCEGQEFAKGAHAEDGIIYGAKLMSFSKIHEDSLLSHGRQLHAWPSAHPTGDKGDVIQGRLMTWPFLSSPMSINSRPVTFEERLKAADRLRGYDPVKPNQGYWKRSVVQVVHKDGTNTKAFFYYASDSIAVSAAGGAQPVPGGDWKHAAEKLPPPVKKSESNHDSTCIFCKIVKGEIPSIKVHETPKTLAFMDINPLSPGHVLVIPKTHAAKTHELSEESMADLGRTLQKVSKAVVETTKTEDYNILQNNGAAAHQVVMHVHYHIIPKPNQEQGLGIKWPTKEGNIDQIKAMAEEMNKRIP